MTTEDKRAAVIAALDQDGTIRMILKAAILQAVQNMDDAQLTQIMIVLSLSEEP